VAGIALVAAVAALNLSPRHRAVAAVTAPEPVTAP
jgi:hypothetical protein